jgi:cation transport ATPase
VLVLLVFFGHLTPLGALKLPVAVSGHEGSTVIVILNGLRLLAERRGAIGEAEGLEGNALRPGVRGA